MIFRAGSCAQTFPEGVCMADSAESMKKFREILELDPGSRVFASLAEELAAAGQWDEAARVCKKGLVFHPGHLVARLLLGRALMETGDPEEAERVLSDVTDEIRMNSVVFKQLSELAAISGKTRSSAEFARMYEVFGSSESVESPATVVPEAPVFSAPREEQVNLFRPEAVQTLEPEAPGEEGAKFDRFISEPAETMEAVEPLEEPVESSRPEAGADELAEPRESVEELMAEAVESLTPETGVGRDAGSNDFESEAVSAIEAVEPVEQGSEWNQFKAEAISSLDPGELLMQPEVTAGRKIGLEEILDNLIHRFAERPASFSEPATVLSDSEKNMIKERIMALLGA